MEKIKNGIWKKFGKGTKLILSGVAAAIVVAILLVIIFAPVGRTSFDAKTSLKEILEISNLSTVQYTYNGVAEVKNEEETEYYVYYEGKVRAGFDIAQVEVIQNADNIVVTIPALTIQTVEVNEGSMDYIFLKSKYDTETTFAEALNACKKDLLEELKENSTFIETGKESARDTILALMEPFLSGVSIDIQFADGQTVDNTQVEVVQ